MGAMCIFKSSALLSGLCDVQGGTPVKIKRLFFYCPGKLMQGQMFFMAILGTMHTRFALHV